MHTGIGILEKIAIDCPGPRVDDVPEVKSAAARSRPSSCAVGARFSATWPDPPFPMPQT